MISEYDDWLAAATDIGVDLELTEGTSVYSLLKNVALLAWSDSATFTADQVKRVYLYATEQVGMYRTLSVAATQWCEERMNSQENVKVVASLRTKLQRQNRTNLPIGHCLITRGTDAVQAQAIMKNKTFGGEALNPSRATAPTASQADAQTGLGYKGEAGSRIEEWSLTHLVGFSTGGFHLIAAADRKLCSLPRVIEASFEKGVCGFADAPLFQVAILAQGPSPVDMEGVERYTEGYIKHLGMTGTPFNDLLGKAAPK
ncbi:hypothetical protein ACGFX8_35325 [Streptomyces sp. NPDC048362]|uniref:hypothetical protein n=1 Tax=Streptomyces sp. NPDC048362 TaxID=3365539 RepID=UPI00372272B9